MPKLIKAFVKKLPQLSGFHMVNFFFNRLNTFFLYEFYCNPTPIFYYFIFSVRYIKGVGNSD